MTARNSSSWWISISQLPIAPLRTGAGSRRGLPTMVFPVREMAHRILHCGHLDLPYGDQRQPRGSLRLGINTDIDWRDARAGGGKLCQDATIAPTTPSGKSDFPI